MTDAGQLRKLQRDSTAGKVAVMNVGDYRMARRISTTNDLSAWMQKGTKIESFAIFTAWRSYASAVLGVVILSVCPSVCHTRALWLIQRTYRRYFYTAWKGNPSSFLHPRVVGGRRPLPPKMGGRSDPPPSKIVHVDRFPPVTSQR